MQDLFFFRFLATGETYLSLSYSYRVGHTTISRIVPEVCSVLWDKLAHIYMKMPSSEDEWLSIADNYNSKWQFPNCLGALDGKHIVMKAPFNSGTMYFNYKINIFYCSVGLSRCIFAVHYDRHWVIRKA